jgi:hypothetical protein
MTLEQKKKIKGEGRWRFMAGTGSDSQQATLETCWYNRRSPTNRDILKSHNPCLNMDRRHWPPTFNMGPNATFASFPPQQTSWYQKNASWGTSVILAVPVTSMSK